MMTVNFFASIRERIGTSNIQLEYSGEVTVSDLVEHLISKRENWKLLREKHVLVAVNHHLSSFDALIKDGDEIAFFPSVTGG